MKKNIVISLLIIIAALVIGTVVVMKNLEAPRVTEVSIVASFYPLAHFAEIVGGDRVEVVNLTPPGAEPHDFEPTPQDIVRLRNAALVLVNGSGFEEWFASVWKSGIIRAPILALAEQVNLLPAGSGGAYDPHIWLDPVLAQAEVSVIRDALIAVDSFRKDTYEKNAAAYIRQLENLDQAYARGLSSCRIRTVISPHLAFQYVGKRYGIDFMGIAGVSPDEEPSPKRMAELADIAKAKGVEYIFFETLVSPKLAETIAKEAGIGTLVLNPIEGLTEDEISAGETYISVMEKNLEQLRKAMDCT
ncbi:MAG: zinc ABC transporter substrate-binding protein [Patescibacteria group bacterium]|mgnify:CR=1 FL=1